MNSFVLRLLFSVCGLLFSVSFAQPEPVKPLAPPKLRFLFIDETAGAYSLKRGSVYRQISTNPYEISAPYIPADFKEIEVYKTLTDPTTGAVRPVKIASVTPPANTPSVLVIITPRPPTDAKTPAVYKVELIDSDPKDFPAGSIRIINRSPVSMAAQFSDSRILAAPGEIKLVQPVTDSRRRILFKIAIQVQQEAGGWQLIQDDITVIRPAERMVGVLVYSPGGMRHMMSASEIAELGPPKPGCFWLAYSDTP